MVQARRWIILGAVMFLVAFVASTARAEKKALKAVKQWSGSVADADLQKDAGEVITSQKAFEKVWKSWKIGDKVPEVDFTKEIVVVITGVGSKLNLAGLKLDEKGNLEVIGMGTLDLGEGFRFVVATVSREGVKKVNGKELPKE